jgi:hypothetical protein
MVTDFDLFGFRRCVEFVEKLAQRAAIESRKNQVGPALKESKRRLASTERMKMVLRTCCNNEGLERKD